MHVHRRALLALVPALLALPCVGSLLREERAAREPVTVILVRHAEKAADDPRDPSLSEAGAARARSLAELFAASGVTHLFSSEFRRTRDTLAPLAALLELETAVVPAADEAALLEKLRALPPGATALVAGHSNTVPSLARALGVELPGLEQHPQYGAILEHDAYDRVFVLTLPPQGVESVAPKLLELRD